MKIYRYWAKKELVEGDITNHFQAGSNESQGDAAQKVQEKIRRFRAIQNGEEKQPVLCEDYETPICEEVVETIDEHNIVTRNRYGALVLNSDTLLFLDIDDMTASFSEWLGGLFGKKKTTKERILERVEKVSRLPEFRNVGFRAYETFKGMRLLLSLPAKDLLAKGTFAELAQFFGTDSLYTKLCLKQGCCRARLTPKPARIQMRTMLKFKFPYAASEKASIQQWLEEYQAKSTEYCVCRLLLEAGPRFNDPAVEYHDKMTGVDRRNPLA